MVCRVSETSANTVLFAEYGAKWRALGYGPAFCLLALGIEIYTGPVVHYVALVVIAAVLMAFTYVQIVAARRHATVILTPTTLSQGTEDVAVADILEVYPEPDYEATGNKLERWQTARVLGELSGIPRKRTGVGLKLAGNGIVQAWAKDEETLREELLALVEAER
ncbi:hypothetical protein ASG56_12305 [Rhodococcus sp. Leaf7]|uniref:hypothetical protein n=1 Tax=unclassified Rhodococcus (in: high G+C Gram-positive bacteria) TaxID=192944 RepID=UPI0006FD9FF2|nr:MULTISPECIES: hypothetical protein [unclassified Rhodococcus (in: high G+C Gram-positive bacteria)]KQU04175.1 hypothetical protein ASG56_12305 [Rhodococcus sp. Leaf7]KQU40360.1 hypothetical protein ASG64_12300 [Rhodococcus sp. Leaf247]